MVSYRTSPYQNHHKGYPVPAACASFLRYTFSTHGYPGYSKHFGHSMDSNGCESMPTLHPILILFFQSSCSNKLMKAILKLWFMEMNRDSTAGPRGKAFHNLLEAISCLIFPANHTTSHHPINTNLSIENSNVRSIMGIYAKRIQEVPSENGIIGDIPSLVLHNTPPKFNRSPLKNGGWKTYPFLLGFGNFSGAS